MSTLRRVIMRIPRRLQSSPRQPPEKFRSIRFLTCLRCMGHGHFETLPQELSPMVAFSRVAALQYLEDLSERGQISTNQFVAVATQILFSGLPSDIPYEVRQVLSDCYGWEEKRVELASVDQAIPEAFQLTTTEVAEAVHRYLLEHRPNLRTQ